MNRHDYAHVMFIFSMIERLDIYDVFNGEYQDWRDSGYYWPYC